MTATYDIVQKLWNLCHVLRDDGITYHQYVTELTYLLFLKMAEETEREDQLPEGQRWGDLEGRDGTDQLQFYREMLVRLGAHGSPRVRSIYANAATSLRQPRSLAKLVDSIDGLDWYSARHEGLGDLYEGLLERNATEQKSGAGQYFTPRPLIESIVSRVQPRPGEVVQDPAAGTGDLLRLAQVAPSLLQRVRGGDQANFRQLPEMQQARTRAVRRREEDVGIQEDNIHRLACLLPVRNRLRVHPHSPYFCYRSGIVFRIHRVGQDELGAPFRRVRLHRQRHGGTD